MKSDKIVLILVLLAILLPLATFLFIFLIGDLPQWLIILILPISLLLFILSFIRSYANSKKNSNNSQSSVNRILISKENASDYLDSLQKRLNDAEVDNQFLKMLLMRSVALMDKLEVAAPGIVPDVERTQALYRLYETSDEKDLGQFVREQERKIGRNIDLTHLVNSSA